MASTNGLTAAKAGTIKIGNIPVNRLGLGTNRITDTEQARQLLEHAVELGITFIDTADVYQMHASEATIGATLSPYPRDLLIATKGGIIPDGVDGTPAHLRSAVEGSLKRLKLNVIDLYQLHRVDPNTPIEDSMDALLKLQQEGKIKYIGLSEVSVEQLERAQKIAEIVSVQNQYNVVNRDYEDLVDYCTEHSIVFIPWFPLGGARGGQEQFAERLGKLASQYKVTSQQLALAWLLKRSPMILPIPGTLSIEHLEDNIRAADINLSEQDYQSLIGN